MRIRPLLGLLGVVIASFTVGFNDSVVSGALVDVRGGLGISYDPGTWLASLYATGQVIGMGFAPRTALIVTPRRFLLFAIILSCAVTLAIPFCDNLTVLYMLRFLQGMTSGFVVPVLLLVALRVLAPPVRLYGLALYAMTATFAPNVSEALAALWTDLVDWRFVFFEALPLFTIAGTLVWYGVAQDEPQYDRIKGFDWTGGVLIVLGFGALSTMLEQGDRWDWFNSPFICVLALISVVALPALIANELIVATPLLGLHLLKRRNFAYAAITLFTFLLLDQSASSVPGAFLDRLGGFRPEQTFLITAPIAASQLILLPVLSLILNIEWVDARVVSFVGMALIVAACIGNTFLISEWDASQFFLWQGLQAVGQPMVIMPLLMMATNTIKNPADGPPASTLVNLMRGLAQPTAVWLMQLIQRWRGGLHYNRLVDQAGHARFAVLQAQPLITGLAPPLLPTGQPRSPGSLPGFMAAVQQQSAVLTVSDTFMVLAAIGVALIVVLLTLAERTYPPRVVFAKK